MRYRYLQEDWCCNEKRVVTDLLEKIECFMHTIVRCIFKKNLIITSQTDDKDKSFYIIKAVNPLLTFRTLSSNIDNTTNDQIQYQKVKHTKNELVLHQIQ